MYTGPHIIKDGLVFGYDTGYGIADNVTSTRFYPGKPGTNLVTGQATAFSNWSGLTGTSTYYTTAEGNQGVHLITTSGGGVRFYSSPTINGISASTQYTISATIKYSGTTPHPNLFYVRQYHNGSQITEGGQFSTGLMVDLGNGWYRAYRTFTTTSTTSYINLQGYQYSSGVDLKIQDLQFELGGFLTPYNGVNGTRSSTASLIDLKETADIDVSNVSFDSTGQPIWDGTNDRSDVTSHSAIEIVDNVSIEYVYKRLSTDPVLDVIANKYHSTGWELFCTTTNKFSLAGRNGDGTYYSTGGSGQAMVNNKFYHLVAQKEGTSWRLYVNGELDSSTTANSVGTWSNTGVLQIGGEGNGYFPNMELPVFKIYNKVLSTSEIKQNYNAYKNRFDI